MANTYSKLFYHIIFSTKGREPLISAGLSDDLYPYIGGIIRARKSMLVEIGGMPDHLHLVIRLRPDLSMAELVRLVKANSSKWINEHLGAIGRFSWQEGYGAFSVGFSQLPGVCEYVRTQAEHHRDRTFQEEYVEFLKRHEIVRRGLPVVLKPANSGRFDRITTILARRATSCRPLRGLHENKRNQKDPSRSTRG